MKGIIVGYGTVGKNLHNELKKLDLDIYDKYKTEYNTKKDNVIYDIAFICVDTPLNELYDCDIRSVRDAINETASRI